jgi:anaerobic dimethyl sulfoxide reductase subunit C (anchor subunit)
MSEWPLIAFTTALQLSCGLALATTQYDRAPRKSNEFAFRALGISIFPIAAMGVLASLFHLGRPLSAWRALSNLPTSRLSVEILLSGLFAVAALAYSWLWRIRRKKGRFGLGGAVSLIGLAAVVSSATVYMAPTEPAWNSPWVPISFLGAALLFCGLAPVSMADLRPDEDLRRIFLITTAAGALVILVSAGWMVVRLSAPPAGEFASARFHEILRWLLSSGSVPLGIFMMLAGVLPMVFAFKLWTSGKPVGGMGRLVLPAALAGAVIGRWLMYAVGTKFFPF